MPSPEGWSLLPLFISLNSRRSPLREAEVKKLLQLGNNNDALVTALDSPPLSSKDESVKVSVYARITAI